MKQQSSGFALVPAEVLAIGNGYAISVYAAIAQHADRSGNAWPSLDRLAEMTGWSRPTIVKAVKMLEQSHVISKQTRNVGGLKQSNKYTLIYHAKAAKSRMETSLPSSETSLTFVGNEVANVGNDVEPGRQPRLQEQEPENKNHKEPDGSLRRVNGGKMQPSPKPLPENGPAQQIVKAFCHAVNIERPAAYRKAVGQAQQLANAGIQPTDIPVMVAWLRQQSWVNGAIDLGLILSQADKWQASRSQPEPVKRFIV